MMFGGGMLLGWLLPVILLVLGGAWLFNGTSVSRSRDNDFSPHNRGKTAEEILQERYARGEITQSEYKEMSETLHR